MSDPGAVWNVPQWTLGWRLQRALAHAGLRAETMADELGVDRRTLSRWMHDKGPVRRGYLSQWALRCGVPFEWLAYGVEPEGPDAPPHQGVNSSPWRARNQAVRALVAVA